MQKRNAGLVAVTGLFLLISIGAQALQIGGTQTGGLGGGYIGGEGGDYCAKKAGYTNCQQYASASAQGYTLTAADANLFQQALQTVSGSTDQTSSNGLTFGAFHASLVSQNTITSSQTGTDIQRDTFQGALNCAQVVSVTGYDTYAGCITATTNYGYLASLDDGRLYNEATTNDDWDPFCPSSECSTAARTAFVSAKAQKSAFDSATARAAGPTDNGTLTIADLTGAGVTLDGAVWTNSNRQGWLVQYLNASENNQASNSPMDNATHPYNGAGSWDSKVDALSASTVIEWVGTRIGSGYLPASNLNADLLSELGVDSALVDSTVYGSYASTLQGAATTAGIDWTNGDNISDWIVGQYGWSDHTAFASAAASGYGLNQQTLWNEAGSDTYLAYCQAIVSSATSCSDLSPSQFQQAKNSGSVFDNLRLLAAGPSDNGTLSIDQIVSAGVSLDTSIWTNATRKNWLVAFVNSTNNNQLGNSPMDNASSGVEWDTKIDALSLAGVSQWYAQSINSGDIAATNFTEELVLALGVSPSLTNIMDSDNVTSTIQTAVATANVDWTSSDNISNWLVGVYDWSSAATFTTASAIGYTLDQADLYADAAGGSYTAACDNYITANSLSGSGCLALNASQFSSLVAGGATLLADLYNRASGVPPLPTLADYTAAGIDMSGVPSDLPEWELIGLAEFFTQNVAPINRFSLTSWQTAIGNYDRTLASRYGLDVIEAEYFDGWSADNITLAMIDSAINNDVDLTALFGMADNRSFADFLGNPLFRLPTADSNNWGTSFGARIGAYMGFTNGSWGDFEANSQRDNFTVSAWNACYASSDNFTGGVNNCSTDAFLWSTGGISLASLYNRAFGIDTPIPTRADYEAVGIDMSAVPSDLADWELVGLAEHFIQNVFPVNMNNLSSWQTAASSYTRVQGNRYALDAIERENHAGWDVSDITASMVSAALDNDIDLTALFGMASAKSFTAFRDGALFDLPTADSNSWAASLGARMGFYMGFTNGSWGDFEANSQRDNFTVSSWNACYASNAAFTGGASNCTTNAQLWGVLPDALANGWTADNYQAALGVTNSDWTNSASDNTAYLGCLASDHIATGGVNTCQITRANWNQVGSASNLAFTWHAAMPDTYILASNNSAFKGCNEWRNKINASITGGTGYTVRYSLRNVPASFSSVSVNASTGILSYDFNSQNNQSPVDLTLVAEAVRDGIVWAEGTETVQIKAINRNALAQNQELVLVRNAPYSGDAATQNAGLNNLTPCPANYELTTNGTKRERVRDLLMNHEFGSAYSRPANYFVEECSSPVWRTNWKTNSSTHWTNAAVTFGRNNAGTRTCLVYDNEGRNTNKNLAPYGGSCNTNWDVGNNTLWFGTNYGCLYVGNDTKYVWSE